MHVVDVTSDTLLQMVWQMKVCHGSVSVIYLSLKRMLSTTSLLKQVKKEAEDDGVEDGIDDVEHELCFHLRLRPRRNFDQQETDGRSCWGLL